jgi:CHAP domain-containing protein
MHSSRNVLLAMISGVVIMSLLVFVALSGMAASFAWTQGSGYGSGPGICRIAAPGMGSPTPRTPGATPALTGTASACVPASAIGAQVVAWARAMADALYVNPACGGRISSPDCYFTWYKVPGSTYPPGAPSFPQAVIQYGQQVCAGCSAWANGTYQCVSFVRGAYSQVYPMTLSANAFDLWALYARQPGWMEIPAAAAPAGQRGIPLPGDVMVFKDASIGHVAIVMSVALPTATTRGAITFSNANSVSPYTTMPVFPDFTVDTTSWPGYTVWGYIRPAGGAKAQVHTRPPIG